MKILIISLVLFCLSGCGQQEIEGLKTENAALKSKVESLEQENAKLKETDQSYFGRGVDALKDADSKSALQTALDLFGQLVEKFPTSPYVEKAQQNIAEIKIKISNLDRVAADKGEFDSALGAHQFSAAAAVLKNLKGLIPMEEQEALNARLYDEKNKPLETSVNKLVSEFGSYKSRGDIQNYLGMLGKRVKVTVTLTAIDRDRKELTADSDGWGEGSHTSVFYEGTNMEDYFTSHDPKCCANRYSVTGVTKSYNNADELYIKAEKIEQIQP